MAQYQSDLDDIYFNLFEVLRVQDHAEGFEANDLKEIIREFDKFVENEVYPHRRTSDEAEVQLKDGEVKVHESFKKTNQLLYENGWYGLGKSEDIGGMPVPAGVEYACISLINGANVSYALYHELARGAMNVILKVGSEDQKNFYIPPMMEGRWGGTMCLTEPGAGSDVGAATTSAKALEDGKYDIKGIKIFISSGENDLYENIIHLVLARTPGAPEGTKGLSLFIVPKIKVNPDGSLGERNDVVCTKLEEKMGLHASATCELTFGQNGGCEGYLIGKECEGIQNMFIMMNEARLLCGVQAESQANLASLLTLQYANERSQFGTEIINFPDVRRLLLKMRSMSRGMRSLIYYTGNLFDLEKKQPEYENEIALLTPICKSYCTDRGFEVSVDAIQVHGGYGYCREYGIEQFARDIKIASIYEGTNAIQAIDFISRKILRDEAKTFKVLGEKIGKTMHNPLASEWKSEIALMTESLGQATEILQHFGKLAGEKKNNVILGHAMEFLDFSGNLIVSWLLLRSAIIAQEKLNAGDKEYPENFLKSKVDDFKFFTHHFLVNNSSIYRSITKFETDLSGLVL